MTGDTANNEDHLDVFQNSNPLVAVRDDPHFRIKAIYL